VREVIHDFAQWLAKKSYTPPKNAIQYICHVEGMDKWAAPRPMSRWVPEWYKRMPKNNSQRTEKLQDNQFQRNAPLGIHPDFGLHGETIKTCPGMQDIMTTGFMLPFWSNAIITTTQDGKQVLAHTSTDGSQCLGARDGENNSDFTKISMLDPDSDAVHQYLIGMGYTTEEIGDWRKFQKRPEISANFKVHPQEQYSTMVEHLPEEWCKCLLKLETPWRIVTPPGWSILYTDPTYYFNDCIQVMPGVLNTDYWHESNMFFFIKRKGIQFSMNFGDPLICHIPIKRSMLPLEVRKSTEEERQRDRKMFYFNNAHWSSARAYRKYLDVFGYKEKGECPHKKD